MKRFFAGLILLSLNPVFAGPGGEDTSVPVIRLYESSRFLEILPFRNASGDGSLDYLSAGLPRMIQGKIRLVPFVWEESPRKTFQANPRGLDLAREHRQKNGRVLLETRFRSELEVDSLPALDRLATRAGQEGSDYVLAGEFRIQEKKLREGFYRDDQIALHVVLYDAIHGREHHYRKVYPVETIYREVESLASEIGDELTRQTTIPVRVESKRPGAMAYLDEIYLGRTPVRGRVVPGTYTLTVEEEDHETYRKEVEIEPGKESVFFADPVPVASKAGLVVSSDPEGAGVYLDIRKLGTTPFRSEELSPGTHRVRISLDGFVDRFIGVDLKNGETKEIAVTLKEGDTAEHFGNPETRLMDWTNHDFAFYSMFSSLFFYGNYWYWNVKAERAEESVFPYVLSMSLLDYPQGNLYYNHIIEEKRHEADRYRRYANVSAGLGVGAILTGGFFLWRELLDDERDIGEVDVYAMGAPRSRSGEGFYAMGLSVRF